MFFRLFLSHPGLSLYGAIGKHGKLYFSAMDVGLVLGEENLLQWVKKVASCKLSDVIPESYLSNEWMIEENALMTLLSLRIMIKTNIPLENKLLKIFRFGHVSVVRIKPNFWELEECSPGRGKLFSLWLQLWKIEMQRT